MSFVKYAMFLLLALAAAEASTFMVISDNRARMALAVLFLLYGCWALNLFRRRSVTEVHSKKTPEARPTEVGKKKSIPSVIFWAVYLLLLRIFFVICVLAYLAQTASLYDPAVVTTASESTYLAYLLAVLQHTFPPLGDLVQLVFPDSRPAVWNYNNPLTILLRLLTYVIYFFVIGSVVKEVWLLARRREFEKLEAITEAGMAREDLPDEEDIGS